MCVHVYTHADPADTKAPPVQTVRRAQGHRKPSDFDLTEVQRADRQRGAGTEVQPADVQRGAGTDVQPADLQRGAGTGMAPETVQAILQQCPGKTSHV